MIMDLGVCLAGSRVQIWSSENCILMMDHDGVLITIDFVSDGSVRKAEGRGSHRNAHGAMQSHEIVEFYCKNEEKHENKLLASENQYSLAFI